MQRHYVLCDHRVGGVDDSLVPAHFLPRSELGPDIFKLELSLAAGPDHDEVCMAEFRERHGYRINVEEGHLIYIRENHLPDLAAMVARRCRRSTSADHEDSLVTCLRILVDRGVLGPQLGFGGNDHTLRSWLDRAGIPYRRTASDWGWQTFREESDIPN